MIIIVVKADTVNRIIFFIFPLLNVMMEFIIYSKYDIQHGLPGQYRRLEYCKQFH